MIEVDAVCQALVVHIRSVPFEFCDVPADMQWPQFILGNFSYYFSRNGQYLDFYILRNIASCNREHKGSGCRKRIWIIEHIRNHGLRNNFKRHLVLYGARSVSAFIGTGYHQGIVVSLWIYMVCKDRTEFHTGCIVRTAGGRCEPQGIGIEIIRMN